MIKYFLVFFTLTFIVIFAIFTTLSQFFFALDEYKYYIWLVIAILATITNLKDIKPTGAKESGLVKIDGFRVFVLPEFGINFIVLPGFFGKRLYITQELEKNFTIHKNTVYTYLEVQGKLLNVCYILQVLKITSLLKNNKIQKLALEIFNIRQKDHELDLQVAKTMGYSGGLTNLLCSPCQNHNLAIFEPLAFANFSLVKDSGTMYHMQTELRIQFLNKI